MKNNIVSVVIPAFNEENKILSTLERIKNFQNRTNIINEIIIVDDCSTDRTLEVINKFSYSSFEIIKLKNDINMGKGFSVKRGMLVGKSPFILFMDADSSVDIENLPRFLKECEDTDVVIASIEVEGHRVVMDDNFVTRRFLGKISKKLIKLLVLNNIEDSQRGFKLFNQKARNIIFNKQTINGWGFDIEILLIAIKNNLKIRELPVVWNNPKSSSLNLLSYFLTLRELLFIKINSWRGLYDSK